jgi:putative redox protein
MIVIKANIGRELYRIEIKSPAGMFVIADEPIENGGQGKGFAPKELLASALGACTCGTLRMYADRSGWDLDSVDTEVSLIQEEGQTRFNRKVTLVGQLDQRQRERLLKVANSCPVHKILTGSIIVETSLE